MELADANCNTELSFTEVTEMLAFTEHSEFGKWIKRRKQKGFRDFDNDMQGTLDVGELTLACEAFLQKDQAPQEKAPKPQARGRQRQGPASRSGTVRPHSSYQHLVHKGKDVNSLQWEAGLRPSM